MRTITPPPQRLSEDIPFGQAKQLSIELPSDVEAQGDIFLDDGIIVGIDTPMNTQRMKAAMPLAMEIMGRRSQKDEPIERPELIKRSKAIAEGALEEIKIVTGWELDSRRLLISLPSHKFIAWTSQIDGFLTSKKATAAALESFLGRKVHTSTIMPLARHFLARLRFRFMTMQPYKSYTLNDTHCHDLQICKRILERARDGISMNSVVFRLPTICYFVDACNYGIGGWDHLGEFFDFDIPIDLLGRAHINGLEFLANLVHLWVDIKSGRIKRGDCVLMMGDSTTAMGWLHRSKYRE